MIHIYCFHGCGQEPVIFQSLTKSLQKNLKEYEWVYLKGNYPKNEGGWGWYKYKDNNSKVWDDNMEIDQTNRKRDLVTISNMINEKSDPENSVLIGFSEGGQFVLDLAQIIPNIRGVVAMSPAYQKGLNSARIMCPVILITSSNDSRVMKRYSDKWKKIIENITEIDHTKGHKVYLPLETRQIIRGVLDI